MIEKLYQYALRPSFWLALGAVLLIVVSLTGLPMGNDEGVWAYIGRLWADHGLLPYTGAIENKATGIFMVYALSHRLFGFQVWFPRLLAMVATLGTGWLMYRLAMRMAGKRAALFALAVFVLVMPLGAVDGGYAETENFMNLFRIATFLLTVIAYDKEKYRGVWLVASGITFAWAIAFKQLAVTDALPLLVFHSAFATGGWRTVMRHGALVACGVVAGTGVSLLPYVLSGGTIPAYLDGAWRILFQSGSSPPSIVSRISGFFRHFFNARLAPVSMGAAAFVLVSRAWRGRSWRAPLLAWLAADFIAYNADGWYLDHHYKVFLPSWSLAFGIVADWALSQIRLVRDDLMPARMQERFAALFLGALVVFYVPFETNYFHSIRKAVKGEFADAGERALGEYLKNLTAPSDRVYIWGFHMGVSYYYSDRLAPGRYFSEPFLGRPGALLELMRDLDAHPPRIVAVPELPYRALPDWLPAYLSRGYKQTATRFGHHLYERL